MIAVGRVDWMPFATNGHGSVHRRLERPDLVILTQLFCFQIARAGGRKFVEDVRVRWPPGLQTGSSGRPHLGCRRPGARRAVRQFPRSWTEETEIISRAPGRSETPSIRGRPAKPGKGLQGGAAPELVGLPFTRAAGTSRNRRLWKDPRTDPRIGQSLPLCRLRDALTHRCLV